jgi:hypothetical protein
MAARGNDVALAIEAKIREAVEKMVGDIRSSIDDVREAVNQQLQAALQSVQADANALSFRPTLEKTLDEFESSIVADAPAASPAEPVAAAAPAEPVADASRVKRAVQAVERGKTQVEVLNALLEQALQFGSRAALLILKGDSFAGWKGMGFGRTGGNDEAIKRFTSTPGGVPELDRVIREETVVSWDGGSLSAKLAASAPTHAVLVPMVIKDKIAAALYVDQMADDSGSIDLSSIELLVFTTGLLIDTLAIRKKIPSPSLSDSGIADVPPQATAPAAPAPTPRPAPSPAPPSIAGTIAVPGLSMADDFSDTSAVRRAIPKPQPAPTPAPNFATTAMPALREPVPSTPPPAPPVSKPAPGGFGDATADKPSTQYIPPPGLRGGGALGPQTDETKKHDEARRFARLLVSEIKLYNESKVEQGRKNKDLYERMKEDIDRSRQMYDERIGEEIRKSSNYFYDELVRILADGDADTLGL